MLQINRVAPELVFHKVAEHQPLSSADINEREPACQISKQNRLLDDPSESLYRRNERFARALRSRNQECKLDKPLKGNFWELPLRQRRQANLPSPVPFHSITVPCKSLRVPAPLLWSRKRREPHVLVGASIALPIQAIPGVRYQWRSPAHYWHSAAESKDQRAVLLVRRTALSNP